MSVQRGRKNSPIDFTTLTPYQDEFLRADKRYLGFVSGVGAGKTYAGIVRTFLNMEHWNPGEMGAIVAPTRQMVVNVIIPEMRELGLLDNWEYNSTYSDEPGLHAPNGSRALILSADNQKTIERLRGLNLAWGWIDERTAVPHRAQEILLQRLRVGNYRNLYETTTPKGKDDTYDFYVGDVDSEARTFGDATLYETDDRVAIVGVPTRANPELPDDYQEAMSTDMPEQIRAQEIQGQFVEIGSGVLQRDMLNWVNPNDLPEREHQWLIGVDLGVQAEKTTAREQDSDYWAAAVLAVDPAKNNGYLIDLRRERGMTLREGISWLKGIANNAGRGAEILIESNQAQRFFTQEAENAGLNVSAIQNTENKEDRLIQLSIPFDNETIRIVDWGDNRFQPFIDEWIGFPESSHDDCLDAVEIAVSNARLESMSNIVTGDVYDDE